MFCHLYQRDHLSVVVVLLKSDSHLPKKTFLFASMPFKNDEKCFLFQLKSPFRSQDI